MVKKFWRSGMIDKKVVKEREQAEYINKLHRTILELTREESKPKYAIIHTSDNRSHKVRIADEYDEMDKFVDVVINLQEEGIIHYDDVIYRQCLKRYFKRLGEKNENNTRTLRQEE